MRETIEDEIYGYHLPDEVCGILVDEAEQAEPRVCCQDKPRKYRPGISVTPRRCTTRPCSTAAGMWIQVYSVR